MPTRFKKLMLFTGAGFTKNFGGFLGWEMWAKIFNNPKIQAHQRVADLMRDNFDFESIYAQVVRGGSFTDVEVEAMKGAVNEAYKSLDGAVRQWVFNDSNPIALNTYGLGSDLFGLFHGAGENGLYFTLNQDLYIERHNGFVTPGAPRFPFGNGLTNMAELTTNQFLQLPAADVAATKFQTDIESMSGIAYIKLHGSYGWKSADGGDQMIIGHDKIGDIDREPLLKKYFDFFKEQINEGDKRMLVIGYGFADMHINQALLDAVQNHGLKLYVIAPSPPKKLFDHFQTGGHYYAMDIWKGIAGYFPYSLREIFPPSQDRTGHFNEIKQALLA